VAQAHPISRLGGWEGYLVTEDWSEVRAGQSVCVIRLEPIRGYPRCCSGCGTLTAAIHDLEDRRVRDLPVFEHRVELIVPRLRAAVMDMSAGYEFEVRAHCPNAAIAFDLFHVVAKYGREVIDRVRVDRANELRGDRPGRQVVKAARWLLLKNRDSLRPGEDVQLEELLAANRDLFVVYVLRDALKDLWGYRHAGYATRAWSSWYRKALRSGLEPLIRFARRLRPYLPGILAHCRWPLGTNLVEGINNKIKVIKRMAYGFRDDAYFFLKIRAAFPGVGR
jgi:transposase